MLRAAFLVLGRQLFVKRTRFVGASFLFLLGVFGIYYCTSDSTGDQLFMKEPARTIKMPPLDHHGDQKPVGNQLASLTNTSINNGKGSKLHPVNRTNRAVVDWPGSPGVKGPIVEGGMVSPPGIHMMPSDTEECLTSDLQPELGHFNIQISSVMETLPFDNQNGGVWKQGFELTYSMDEFVNPLQVIIVPHSHNDPGWLKTFEDYYVKQTKNILTVVTNSLAQDLRKKFIWAEISYLDLWWKEQDVIMKNKFQKLVENGQLEIVTGGWVMNDEANTHYYAMLDQLLEGHTWLQQNLPGVVPRASWSCDPFGYSPTMAYLLRQAGMESMFIQRAHYNLKKHLARQKQLEFHWVQEWDRGYQTGVWCHVMPFYIYDIPHTCGPDPKICCQFDFLRLPGNKINCPWKVRPQAITEFNVRERAETLADQYRKKSMLYKSNVVLIPLGDDFRWETTNEMNVQFDNYYKLIDYMNSHSEMRINVKFGTLSDYFHAVKKSVAWTSSVESSSTFPTLAGDFFTYADRDDNYWSGYFTSRPFHKHMDRVLESTLRMAEIFYSLTVAKGLALSKDVDAARLLTNARRNLALFQHHDAITGTSKDYVVNDFAMKTLAAIKSSQQVTQGSLKALLSSEHSEIVGVSNMQFFPEETYPAIKVLPSVSIINLNSKSQNVVTFVNSLAHKRTVLVSVLVSSPDVMVMDTSNMNMFCQVNPVFHNIDELATNRYQVVFLAILPAMGVAHYQVKAVPPGHPAEGHRVMANIQYINHNGPASFVFSTREYPNNDIILSTPYNVTAEFSGLTGLLRSMSVGSSQVDIDMDFVSYGSRKGTDRSGAYLFLPDGEASSIVMSNGKPRVTIVTGPLVQEVTTFLPHVKHSVVLSNSPGLEGHSLSLHNTIDLRSIPRNKEIAMRLKTSISNKDTFYTDLNGFQLTRRKTYSKIPMQGNFYPMPSSAVLQDSNHRLTLHSRQPLGVASLKQGWLEVILDRRLMLDDSRGLAQGVKDNVVTFEPFKLLVERNLKDGRGAATLVYPSLLSQYTQDSLLHPPSAFFSHLPPLSSLPPPLSFLQAPLPCDMFLVNLRTIFHVEGKIAESALILHRRGFDCGFDMSSLQCEVTNGEIRLGSIFRDVTISEATETSLSLFHDRNQLELKKELSSHLDTMQIQTYRVVW